jgi:methylphosphotriester-DNA--protein-cysteine methyltransferase
VRAIDDESHEHLTLETLAGEAGLSPYHFLRTFERSTGVTPHQYVSARQAAQGRAAAGRRRRTDHGSRSTAASATSSNFNRAFPRRVRP